MKHALYKFLTYYYYYYSIQPEIIKTIDRLDPTDQKDNVRTESQLRVALILSERDTEFVVSISI